MSVVLAPNLDAYVGLGAAAGAVIAGDEHLRQSIRDILTTPLGSRVMRRSYGSRLYQLIDAPMNPGLVADIVAASADAILRWEPRVTLKRVLVRTAGAGRFALDLVISTAGRSVTLEGVL